MLRFTSCKGTEFEHFENNTSIVPNGEMFRKKGDYYIAKRHDEESAKSIVTTLRLKIFPNASSHLQIRVCNKIDASSKHTGSGLFQTSRL